MTRFKASFSVLVALVAAAGCGDGESSIYREGDHRGVGNATASGGQVGTGGQATGGTDTRQWLYATDDDGVFPKDRVLDIQVEMPSDAWTKLIATAKQEVWSTANVTIDGQSVGNVGFRPKGEYSLDTCVDAKGKLTCDKFSFKLKFDEVDPDGRFYGLKRLVLNQITDGWGMFRESLAYQIFNDFGITAPRTSFAVLTVNGKSFGIYRVVEAVDGRFTSNHFSDHDGNLYKEAWPANTSDAYFKAALETNEDTASNQAYIAFATDMRKATDADLPQTLAKYMDLTRTLDYMAVDYAIANWDGITTFYAGSWGRANHNFYVYQSVDEAKFTLIPWDLNAALFLEHWLGDIKPWDAMDVDCKTPIPTKNNSALGTIPAACDPMIRAIALSKEAYHASVERLLDEVFVLDKLNQRIDEYVGQVTSALQDDPFVSFQEASRAAKDLKGTLPSLRSRAEAVLTGAVGGAGNTSTKGSAGAASVAGAGGASSGGTGGAGGAGIAISALCERLCKASAGLDCYDEAICVNYVETQIVAPVRATCPDATLQAYGVCLLSQTAPTVCSNGLLSPNLALCPTQLQAVMSCAGIANAGVN